MGILKVFGCKNVRLVEAKKYLGVQKAPGGAKKSIRSVKKVAFFCFFKTVKKL